MMGAVHPEYHDIPLFLHCLTNQVERTLSGEAQQKEDEAALQRLEEHLANAFSDAICEGPARSPPTDPVETSRPEPGVPGLPDSGPLLPYLDRAACHHRCGPSAQLDGQPVLASVHEVLSKASVEFWTCLHSQQGDEVPYLSRQNDSLREEFPSLLEDVPEMISLAKEVCGNDPEAVNLWIGDDRSVSSCHKDPYENFYVVVRGEKVFTLLPPASAPFLHETDFPAATYIRKSDGKLEAVLDDANDPASAVPWIPFDVLAFDEKRFPDFAEFGSSLAVQDQEMIDVQLLRFPSNPQVSVRKGELLYLPAMWYHRVAQKGVTIAVNYWHDMQIGHAFLHHQFLRDAFDMDKFP
eukprot:symbB.v1.2.010877.t1/scaffold689.1/size246588/8